MTAADRDAEKARAAEAAVAEVESGMIVGLGTGTTAAYAITALAGRVAKGLQIKAAATSLATMRTAQAAGITVLDFSDLAAVDLCIDGVDEIDPSFVAIKGGGGAMLREKIVARSAARMIAIADSSKRVEALSRAVPVEILPFGREAVLAGLRRIGGNPVLREGATSDQGNLLADCAFVNMRDPRGLAAAISEVPGLLGHGIFLNEVDVLIVGAGEGIVRARRAGS